MIILYTLYSLSKINAIKNIKIYKYLKVKSSSLSLVENILYIEHIFNTIPPDPITKLDKSKKTGDFSPVMIQLFKIKPIHHFRLQCNHLV